MFLPDNGLCFFEPIIVDDVETAHASVGQVRQAASLLILQCAAQTDSQGGIAGNIGESCSKGYRSWSISLPERYVLTVE